MLKFLNKKFFHDFYENYLSWIKVIFIILVVFGTILSLVFSPADYLQGDAVRIMYVHVPASWLSLMIFSIMGICSLISLILKFRIFTLIVKSLAPIGLVFGIISLCTGSLWGRPTWGTFWVWDARLSSMLMLVIIYIAYLVSWKMNKNFYVAEKVSSFIAIIGFPVLPLIKFSVNWWNTLHQPASIKIVGGSTIHPSMLSPLLVMFSAFCILSLIIFFIRFKIESLKLKSEYKQ
jgi:heme exporter protein C